MASFSCITLLQKKYSSSNITSNMATMLRFEKVNSIQFIRYLCKLFFIFQRRIMLLDNSKFNNQFQYLICHVYTVCPENQQTIIKFLIWINPITSQRELLLFSLKRPQKITSTYLDRSMNENNLTTQPSGQQTVQ